MRTIIERYVKRGKNIYLCFIDYEKAFDRVKHEKIIECTENLNIYGKDISLMRNLYWNQKAYMRTEDGLSPEIHIKKGVRQCCVLSPCLFNMYTENIFGAMDTNKGITIGGTTIKICVTPMIMFYWLKQRNFLQEILNEVNRIFNQFCLDGSGKSLKLCSDWKDS